MDIIAQLFVANTKVNKNTKNVYLDQEYKSYMNFSGEKDIFMEQDSGNKVG